MPIDYRIDRSLRIAWVRAKGILHDQDLLDFAARATADPEYVSGVNELIDFRESEVGDVSAAAIRKAAEVFSAYSSEDVKVALVVPTEAGYGLSRMYQAFRGDEQGVPRIFRDMGEARAWLGLDPEGGSEGG